MVFKVAVGTLSLDGVTATNTVSVSGLGFLPKAVLFFGIGSSVVSIGSGTYFRTFGCAVSPSSRWATTCFGTNDSSLYVARRNNRDDACIVLVDDSPAIVGLMDLQSMDIGGFTLICDQTITPSNVNYGYIALGGDIQVAAGSITEPAAPGTQDIDINFKPDCLFFAGAPAGGNTNINAGDRTNFGYVGTDLTQAVCAWGIENGLSSSQNALSYCHVGDAIATSNGNRDGLETRAQVTDWLSDGFRLNWSAVLGALNFYYYLAIAGVVAEVGSFTTNPTLDADTTVSGLSARPQVVMTLGSLFDSGNTAGNVSAGSGASGIARSTFSAFTSTSNRFGFTTKETHNSGTGFHSCLISSNNTNISQSVTSSGGTEGIYDVQSIENDGFVLNTDNEDEGGARFFTFMALSGSGGHNAPLLGTIA